MPAWVGWWCSVLGCPEGWGSGHASQARLPGAWGKHRGHAHTALARVCGVHTHTHVPGPTAAAPGPAAATPGRLGGAGMGVGRVPRGRGHAPRAPRGLATRWAPPLPPMVRYDGGTMPETPARERVGLARVGPGRLGIRPQANHRGEPFTLSLCQRLGRPSNFATGRGLFERPWHRHPPRGVGWGPLGT